MNALTKREVEGYRENGYLILQDRLRPEQLQSLHDATEYVIAANPGHRPEKLVNVHKPGRNPQGLVGDVRFLEYGRDPHLLDIISDILGPDIILWGAQLMCKPPGESLRFPWHQDGAYWPIEPLATCTAWVALDDANAENGCVRLIPGSQRERNLYKHWADESQDLVFPYTVQAEFDDTRAIDIEVEAGQIVLFDVYLFHCSNSNRSRRRRAAISYRYMPGASYIDLSRVAPRPLWLVRGEDRTGRNDFRIHHDT